MAEVLLSILVVAVSSLLEVPNRFLHLERTSGLKIGTVIGFIIQVLLLKKEMTLKEL
jgi:peptidoglycan biosynthesis protein MviN/MurJ (putative lipid II flippase)